MSDQDDVKAWVRDRDGRWTRRGKSELSYHDGDDWIETGAEIDFEIDGHGYSRASSDWPSQLKGEEVSFDLEWMPVSDPSTVTFSFPTNPDTVDILEEACKQGVLVEMDFPDQDTQLLVLVSEFSREDMRMKCDVIEIRSIGEG